MLAFSSRLDPVILDKSPAPPGRLDQFSDHKLPLLVLEVGEILPDQFLLSSVGDIDTVVIIDIEISLIVRVKPDRIDEGTNQPDPLSLISN